MYSVQNAKMALGNAVLLQKVSRIEEHKPLFKCISCVSFFFFYHQSSTTKLVIDCPTQSMNHPTIQRCGFQIHHESYYLSSPSVPALLCRSSFSLLSLECASLRIQPSEVAHIWLNYVSVKGPNCLGAQVSILKHTKPNGWQEKALNSEVLLVTHKQVINNSNNRREPTWLLSNR